MRLTRHRWVLLAVLAALALGAAAAALIYFTRPATLRLAIQRDSEEAPVIEVFQRVLAQQRENVRLQIVPVDDLRQSAAALEHRQVDLAVVRPDVALPVNGLTVAILRQEALLIAAPGGSKLENLDDLNKHRLGIVARHPADASLVTSVLAFYDLASPLVTLVPLALEDVERAFRDRRIDAVAVVAAPAGAEAAAVLKIAARAGGRDIKILSPAEADAIAAKLPTLATVEIPAGALQGRPKLPAEALTTIGISHRLVAGAHLDSGVVAELTRHLFEMRPRLARTTPAANRIEAPESEMSARLPTHPGAIQYLEREELTFFERYGDWIYLGMFSAGGLGSALAWLRQRIVRRRRELVDEILDRLMSLLGEARCATTTAELDGLAQEVDRLVVHAVRYARNRTTDTRTMSALILAIDSARAAIGDRRHDVAGHPRSTATASPDGRAPQLAAASRPA
jgi:TRAP-type uncharacterized transport system substrate-binding protein